MIKGPKVYVLRSPGGWLIPETVTPYRDEIWPNSYAYLCNIYPDFATRYWKRERSSKDAARRRGWKIVKARLDK